MADGNDRKGSKEIMKIRGFSINILGVLTAFMLALFSTSATAGVIWRAGITAFSGDDSNTIYFAAADDATDGFENGYESRAIMAGKLVAYFYHPEWGVDTAYFLERGQGHAIAQGLGLLRKIDLYHRQHELGRGRDAADGGALSR